MTNHLPASSPRSRPVRGRSARLLLTAAVTAVALVAAACGGSDDAAAPTGDPDTGGAAPLEFTADSLDGETFDAASLEGRDTVLWFWAPWCTSCRAEAPDVVASAARFEGSVDVIGVAGRGEEPEMRQFVDDTGTGGLDHLVDDDGSIWTDFDVAAQPAFAFIDDTGEVEVFIGPLGEDALVERMQALSDA